MDKCKDYDEDCWDIEDKFTCWKFDPTSGYCPYLPKVRIDNDRVLIMKEKTKEIRV